MEEVETWDDETHQTVTLTKRVWCLRFPPLQQCRESFEAALKQPYLWDDGAAETGDEAPNE
ncbi:hypothetical protein [Methylocystis sp.]|uniref:hypothetical protein n=1 Tax=Methylocystis sp. TaxID=1911079 RepID=UPI003DA38362